MLRFVTYTNGQEARGGSSGTCPVGLFCDGFIAVGTGAGDEPWHKAGENLALSSCEPQGWCEHWGSAERGTGNRWEMRFLRMLQISEFPARSHTWERQSSPELVSLHSGARTEPEQTDCEFSGSKVNTRSIFLLLWGFENKCKYFNPLLQHQRVRGS